MTPEEACEYLDISMDDDLDLAVLEKNYKAKLSAFGNSHVNRAKIDEAYNILCDLYDELYAHEDEKQKHESLLMKFAVLLAGVFLLSFGGVVYFVYKLNNENMQETKPQNMQLPSQQNSMISIDDYNKLLREIDELKHKQEESARNIPAPANTPVTENATEDFSRLVEHVAPSIVFIKTDRGQGSGFFVSEEGDIMTNYHVIEKANYITVTFHDGKTANALLKDYDSLRDMALLKVNLSYSVPFLKISSNIPKPGNPVIAIGSPRGLTGTVSNGIVSAVRIDNHNKWVQFTAPVSPGSSGGALLNPQGEVVGMPTRLITDSQNLNFAVAPDVLRQFLSSAVNKAARALHGTMKPSTSQRPMHGNYDDRLKFIRSDEGYDIYLDVEDIYIDELYSSIASFVSVWIPTEKTNANMKRDPNFNAIPGKNFGPCILLYAVNLNDGRYIHLRTLNLYTDGTIARDYVRPSEKYDWEMPSHGSRAEILIREVRKQLRR